VLDADSAGIDLRWNSFLVSAAALNAGKAGVGLHGNFVFAGLNHPGFSGEFYQEARTPDNLTEFDQWRDNTGPSCPPFCLSRRSGDSPPHAEDI
jgi:hypothetical protein